jgi:hypothetical protein
VVEERSHRAADHLGVPEVHGAREGDRGGGAEGRGRPEERADVAGVLDAVEEEDACARGECELHHIGARHLRDREHALGRVGVGRARELAVAHLEELDAALGERAAERRAARRGVQVRGHERADDAHRRGEQLLDRADALGDEEPVPLAGAPAAEVAG